MGWTSFRNIFRFLYIEFNIIKHAAGYCCFTSLGMSAFLARVTEKLNKGTILEIMGRSG